MNYKVGLVNDFKSIKFAFSRKKIFFGSNQV